MDVAMKIFIAACCADNSPRRPGVALAYSNLNSSRVRDFEEEARLGMDNSRSAISEIEQLFCIID
jgi:hypothetical protein